jgi:hypothetical protein
MLTAAQQYAIDRFAKSLLALSDDALIDTYHQAAEDHRAARAEGSDNLSKAYAQTLATETAMRNRFPDYRTRYKVRYPWTSSRHLSGEHAPGDGQGTEFPIDAAIAAAFPAETAADLADSPQEGTVMDVENTDLERRVLAHEQILQVLIAHMAEAEPKFLDRLQQIFTKHHTLGADEQDYTGTAAYAEQFIQQVVRLREKARRS